LTVPILDWGRRRNNVMTQTITLSQRKMELDNLNEQTVKEIREVVRTVYEAAYWYYCGIGVVWNKVKQGVRDSMNNSGQFFFNRNQIIENSKKCCTFA